MKKLLALILCVMMFVAVIPTAAFAAGTTGGEATPYAPDKTPKFDGTYAAKKAITDIGKDIRAMYTAIAADESVYQTAKGIYDMTDSLAKEMLKDTDKLKINNKDVYNDKLAENVRKGLNHLIGDEISNYMNDHMGYYVNDAGNIKPEKYVETWTKAVNKALGSEKAQKNIEAVVYGIAALNAIKISTFSFEETPFRMTHQRTSEGSFPS
jgi:hypothetical protein